MKTDSWIPNYGFLVIQPEHLAGIIYNEAFDISDEDWKEGWAVEGKYFSLFYFRHPGRDKEKKMKQFIYDNNLRIITGNYKNKEVDKLRIKHEQDNRRMHAKIKELNLKNHSISSVLYCDNPQFISKLYYKGKEIIY